MEIDQRGGSEERQVEGSTVDRLENQEAGFKTASPMQSIQPKAEVKYQVPHYEMVSAEKLPKQLTKEEIERMPDPDDARCPTCGHCYGE